MQASNKATWLQDTGYAQWCQTEAGRLKALFSQIQLNQVNRLKAIDELLGITR
jgi:hypothetical protein